MEEKKVHVGILAMDAGRLACDVLVVSVESIAAAVGPNILYKQARHDFAYTLGKLQEDYSTLKGHIKNYRR